jgi:hypothetical protein
MVASPAHNNPLQSDQSMPSCLLLSQKSRQHTLAPEQGRYVHMKASTYFAFTLILFGCTSPTRIVVQNQSTYDISIMHAWKFKRSSMSGTTIEAGETEEIKWNYNCVYLAINNTMISLDTSVNAQDGEVEKSATVVQFNGNSFFYTKPNGKKLEIPSIYSCRGT